MKQEIKSLLKILAFLTLLLEEMDNLHDKSIYKMRLKQHTNTYMKIIEKYMTSEAINDFLCSKEAYGFELMCEGVTKNMDLILDQIEE